MPALNLPICADGELRPHARARGAVNAPAPRQPLDEIQAEAAAVSQIRRAPRDRPAVAAIRNVYAQNAVARLGPNGDHGIRGRVSMANAVGDELTHDQLRFREQLLHPFAAHFQRERRGVAMPGPRRTEARQQYPVGSLLQDVSNAMVALHKEQFGRGPTRAESHFADDDALLCIMEDALLPAERTMVEMGEQQRVRESRMFLQVATAEQFIATVETITGRTVRGFASATDPDHGIVMETFIFESE